MVKRGTNSSTLKKSLGKLSAGQREELLIENFIGLQKAMTNLSMKFENLSENISKLLHIFELSARDYMLNKGKSSPQVDRELMSKINDLVEQNRALSRSVQNISQMQKSSPQITQPKSLPQINSFAINPYQAPKEQSTIPQGYQQSQDLQMQSNNNNNNSFAKPKNPQGI